MNSRAHVHNTDCAWMKWLRACSKIKGSSGHTLYDEYTRCSADWQASVHKLSTVLYPCWPFCRGESALSSADIASARHRYLDMYPLTKEQLDSAAYVDCLLQIDKAQIELRCKGRSASSCPACAKKDLQLAKMRAALSDAGMVDEVAEIDISAVTAIFRRYFIIDPAASTSRTEVRTTLETILQQEVGPDESLSVCSPVWKAFMRRTLQLNGTTATAVRCRLRTSPLAAQDLVSEDCAQE